MTTPDEEEELLTEVFMSALEELQPSPQTMFVSIGKVLSFGIQAAHEDMGVSPQELLRAFTTDTIALLNSMNEGDEDVRRN